MQNDNPSWIVLAHLLRPQGRKGELLAELMTDFPDRFKERPQIFLAPSGFKGKSDEARNVEVTSTWLPLGKNKGRIVLHFAGIDSISDAEAIVGMDVVIPFAERLPLDDESVYTSDLVGCTIYDNGVAIGVVGSLALMRFLRTLLWGVMPADPLTYVIAITALATVAILACYLPTRQVLDVDAAIALRYE